VPNRAALILAVESFFEAGPPRPYAAADAAEILRRLPSIGYDPSLCFLLTGTRTTKAVIESHLQRLYKLASKVDTLLVLVITRAFTHHGRGYFVCADTIRSDLPLTALALADFFTAMKKARCPEVVLLFDVEPLLLPDQSVGTGWDRSELARLVEALPNSVALLASEPGQPSYDSAQLRRGVWRHHLIEMFSGKVYSSNVSKTGKLTVEQLQLYLEEAVPRSLRRIQSPAAEQTPLLIGPENASFIVADLSRLFTPSHELLDPGRMKRVVFRKEWIGKIKDLAGYRKTHSLPDRANEWARKFVNRIAAADIKADLDSLYDRVREQFEYKRKEVDVACDRDGFGFIRTPDFDYSVSIAVNPEEPTEVIWRRELSRLSGRAFVESPPFQVVFGTLFDQLVFEFTKPVDVGEFVDRLEESPLEGVKIQVASDANTAVITLAGFTGKVLLTPSSVTIEGQLGNPANLLEQFLRFLSQFSAIDEPQALPHTQ
jgi:hypothetical protein